MISRILCLQLTLIVCYSSAGADSSRRGLPRIPKGFPIPAIPVDAPLTPEKVRLGRYLFYDKRMSVTELLPAQPATAGNWRLPTGAAGQGALPGNCIPAAP